MEIHLGYYITAKERTEEITTTEIRCSENRYHINHPRQIFCGECGTHLGPVEVTETRTLRYDDIPDEDITDHFVYPDYCSAPVGKVIIISNYIGCGGFKIREDEYEEIAIDNLVDIKKKQFDKFMAKHEHDIELLKKYVYDDVEIKYGFVTYDY